MLSLVVYDISENKPRNDLIKKLRHFGLRRLQKSVFVGDLGLQERLDLAEDLQFYLSSEKDSIIIFPFCDSCKEAIIIEGAASIPDTNLTYTFV